MKNGKLLFLLVAILSLTLLFAACDNGASPDEPGTDTGATNVGSGTDAVESTTGEETQEAETEQEMIDHEICDYLVLEAESPDSLNEVSRFNGKMVSFDRTNGLLTLKTQDLDARNNVVETYKVYDINTGEVIFERSVSNLYQGPAEAIKTLSVSVQYPTICVSEGYYSVSDSEMRYNVKLFAAKKGEVLISESNNLTSADAGTYAVESYKNGLVSVTVAEKTYWMDRDMNVIRSVPAIAQNGYDGTFNAEYQGYLYAWDAQMLKVFNRAGICSGEYYLEHKGILNVNVLDDGNVLIQDAEIVDEYTPCSFVLDNIRYAVKSYVMTSVNGALTAVDLDFLVVDIETAYADEYVTNSNFPFRLAVGRDNQAYIYRFANGTVAPKSEYVVMDNDLKIEYTVKNDTVGVTFADADVVNGNYYCATVKSGAVEQKYVFDLDGNVIGVANGNVVDGFIVTTNKIYDFKLNVVLDLEADGYEADVRGNTVYLRKFNYVSGAIETFVFDGKDVTLIANGIDSNIYDPAVFGNGAMFDGYYLVIDDDGMITVYTVDGKDLLVSRLLDVQYRSFEGGILFTGEYNGEDVVYVVK